MPRAVLTVITRIVGFYLAVLCHNIGSLFARLMAIWQCTRGVTSAHTETQWVFLNETIRPVIFLVRRAAIEVGEGHIYICETLRMSVTGKYIRNNKQNELTYNILIYRYICVYMCVFMYVCVSF